MAALDDVFGTDGVQSKPCFRQELEFQFESPKYPATEHVDDIPVTDHYTTSIASVSTNAEAPPSDLSSTQLSTGDLDDDVLVIPTTASSTSRKLETEAMIAKYENHTQTQWQAKTHPDHGPVSETVNTYFLRVWPFPSDRERTKFVQAGFSQVTCLYFPLGRAERIELACRLLTVLFLLDDVLENKSLEDGAALNQRLMKIILQDVSSDVQSPSEMILNDIFAEMRSIDPVATREVANNTCVFMEAQTDKARLEMQEIGQYLKYRESDVGKALLCSLMTFTMCLELQPTDLQHLSKLERYHARHISVVNDILSFEKEKRAAEKSAAEGSILCNAVDVLSTSMHVPAPACEKILWMLVREWEIEFDVCADDLLKEIGQRPEELVDSSSWAAKERMDSIRLYVQGLRLQMSGNEVWSLSTPRYHDLS